MNANEQVNFLNEMHVPEPTTSNLPVYHDVRRPTQNDIGTRVRHGEYGLGTIEAAGKEEDRVMVRFDVRPMSHWAFAHIEVNSVLCRDLEVAE